MRPAGVILSLWLFLAGTVCAAAAPVFPYETIVESETAYARSGPGSEMYYPTSKLRRGQPVTVHRHDPGGWHMIAPPPGSFSWIPAKHVQKVADDRGTVVANNVAVRVGSFESDIRTVFQRKLAEGDTVSILGEKQLVPETGDGSGELWYRIVPPPGEWRWINGQTLAPPQAGGASSPTALSNVEARPTTARRPVSPQGTDDPFEHQFESPVIGAPAGDETDPSADRREPAPIVERPLVRRTDRSRPPESPRQQPPAPQKSRQLEVQLAELDQMDSRFRFILDREPREWDFAQLAEDYRRLGGTAASDNVRQMVDSRLSKISAYEKTQSVEAEAQRLNQTTLQRDAELAGEQRRHESQAKALRYAGAGIVQRASHGRSGGPRYALLAPGGRVLAYLVAGPRVSLETWVGRSAGVLGTRVAAPDLRSDLITVTGLVPVKLEP